MLARQRGRDLWLLRLGLFIRGPLRFVLLRFVLRVIEFFFVPGRVLRERFTRQHHEIVARFEGARSPLDLQRGLALLRLAFGLRSRHCFGRRAEEFRFRKAAAASAATAAATTSASPSISAVVSSVT